MKRKIINKKIFALVLSIILCMGMISLAGCESESYNIIYNGNGNTQGEAPIDETLYTPGSTATILDNTGELAKEGFIFAGWNSHADGTGTDYEPDSQVTMNGNRLLHAKWITDSSAPSYARLVAVRLKPTEVSSPGVTPIWHLLNWDNNVKLNKFTMTFGQTGLESPAYTFKQGETLQQGVFYDDITALDAQNLPMNEYTSFAVESTSNYFTRVLSAERTLSFRASFFISNFAQPEYSTPIVSSIGTIGGSTSTVFEEQNYHIPQDVTELVLEHNDYTLSACGFAKFSTQFVFEIFNGTPPEEQQYNVIYNGNGTTQSVPTDNINYFSGSYATIKPQGSMLYDGFIFTGWNSLADGSGTEYSAGDTIEMTQNITLYAQWIAVVDVQIIGKAMRDVELNGATYDIQNSQPLTDDYQYGMSAYLYVKTSTHPTIKISDFVGFIISPQNAVVDYVYTSNGQPIGYNDEITTPTNSTSQVVVVVKVMQGDTLLVATQISLRKLPE